MIKRILNLLIFVIFIGPALFAQVTTGMITGTVKDNSGHGLNGATITATHIPTGSVYRTISGKDGAFNLPNLRVGGPYQLTVSFVGFANRVFDNLSVTLGTPLVIDAVLESTSGTLNEVTVVTTGRGSIISSQRTGTSTNISQRQLQELPTITRNITEFAR